MFFDEILIKPWNFKVFVYDYFPYFIHVFLIFSFEECGSREPNRPNNFYWLLKKALMTFESCFARIISHDFNPDFITECTRKKFLKNNSAFQRLL